MDLSNPESQARNHNKSPPLNCDLAFGVLSSKASVMSKIFCPSGWYDDIINISLFQVSKELSRLEHHPSEHFLNAAVDCHLRMSNAVQVDYFPFLLKFSKTWIGNLVRKPSKFIVNMVLHNKVLRFHTIPKVWKYKS